MDISKDFQTPPAVCRYMASLIPDHVKTVLEPTKGLGNLVEALEGYDVTAPNDYFLLDKKSRFDCVVMNPPFSTSSLITTNAPAVYKKDKGMKVGYRILNECTQMSDYIIALMPVFTLTDSDVRMRFFKRFGMVSVTFLPRKTFEYIRIQTCIMQLCKGYSGPTELLVYDLLPVIPHKNELILNF